MGTIMAKALNSTLGTSNFKSFDVLLYDVLKRIQMESKVLYYSDTEVLMPVPKETSKFRSSDGFKITTMHQPLMSFRLPHSGTIVLTFDIGFDDKSDSKYLVLEIFRNGVAYDTYYTSSEIDTESHSKIQVTGEADDLIEVKVSVTNQETGAASTSTAANIYLYNICALVKEVRPVEFL